MSKSLAKVADRFGVDAELLDQFHAHLSRADQQALDDLLESTQLYQSAANLAASQPIELLLITMLLEEHKKIAFLFDQLNYYQQKYYDRRL